ncbi:hypothetical protein O181_015321 [Austropuccinia psidii MF-1]|uniref:Reverse transcriptase/retrotransposon-derived protein RNase H-like domain-containing protein n=1 Tax=Austropuccinia psidii MF-1 TaxID=1389203 RepID=A0A9Q3BZR8_9BASI|nr:hypothetical protein [Austropuccinia psidii MF-1]
MGCMKGFHQNGVKPNSMKLIRIICHMGIYEYTRIPLGIKNAPAHFERMMETIFQEQILECNIGQQELLALGHKVLGLSLEIDQKEVAAVLKKPTPRNIKEMQSFFGLPSYYRNHIKSYAHINSGLYKVCSKDLVCETNKERRDEYQRIKYELTNAPVLLLPDFKLQFKLEIDAASTQGAEAALHQRQIVDDEPREGVICYISRKLKDSEARYGATKTECLL